jgi:hypothetical protein
MYSVWKSWVKLRVKVAYFILRNTPQPTYSIYNHSQPDLYPHLVPQILLSYSHMIIRCLTSLITSISTVSTYPITTTTLYKERVIKA